MIAAATFAADGRMPPRVNRGGMVMNRHAKVASAALVVIVTLLVVSLPGPAARAATVQRYYFSLSGENMHPVNSSIGYDNYDGYLVTTGGGGATIYSGQLNLEQGSTITGVKCQGFDTDPTQGFSFRLYRYSITADPVYEAVTDQGASGGLYAGGKISVSAPVLAGVNVVRNLVYSYGIYLILPVAYSATDLGVLRCLVTSVKILP